MEAIIKLKIRELDSSLIEKIKLLFASNEEAVLTISIGKSEEESLEGESVEYTERLRRSKENLENNRNLISFTMEELEAYTNSKRP